MTFWFKLKPSNCRFMKYSNFRSFNKTVLKYFNPYLTGKMTKNGQMPVKFQLWLPVYHCQSANLPLTDGPWHLLFESKFMWMVHRVTMPALRVGQQCLRGLMMLWWKIKPSIGCLKMQWCFDWELNHQIDVWQKISFVKFQLYVQWCEQAQLDFNQFLAWGNWKTISRSITLPSVGNHGIHPWQRDWHKY